MIFDKTIVLRGGLPWGFRLLGGNGNPIYVSKVRTRSKAHLGGLNEGDVIVSVNGWNCCNFPLRKVNNLIDSATNELIMEVKSLEKSCSSYDQSPTTSKNYSSTFDFRQDQMQHDKRQFPSKHLRTQVESSRDMSLRNINRCNISVAQNATNILYQRETDNTFGQRHMHSSNTTNQNFHAFMNQVNMQPTQKYYTSTCDCGYLSDTDEIRKSSLFWRPVKKPVEVRTPVREPTYFSDTECVSKGAKYYRIKRSTPPTNQKVRTQQIITSPYKDSRLYSDAAYFYSPLSQTSMNSDYDTQSNTLRSQHLPRMRDVPFDYEGELSSRQQEEVNKLGADLQVHTKNRYADSSFYSTPHNIYPTIEEQKRLARHIASILEGGDPSSSLNKFERQRYIADQAITENQPTYVEKLPRKSHFNKPQLYLDLTGVPECIQHSIQQVNQDDVLRCVASPPEFKLHHLQDHTIHTNVSPKICMNIAKQLHEGVGKGALLFQKRKARSEKWVVDENKVKKSLSTPPVSPPVKSVFPASAWALPRKGSTGVQVDETFEDYNRQMYKDFNARPRGWTTSTKSFPISVNRHSFPEQQPVVNLSIDQPIREGIQEQHRRPLSIYSEPPSTRTHPNRIAYLKNQYSYLQWMNEEANKPKEEYDISREGIQNLKKKLMHSMNIEKRDFSNDITNRIKIGHPAPDDLYRNYETRSLAIKRPQEKYTDL